MWWSEACCFIGEAGDPRPTCTSKAEWQVDGPGFEDQTFACTEHVGDLLGDESCYVITPVKQEEKA